MFDTRNIGYLQADFKAGDDITQYIFSEIKKRRSYWNGNTLHSLELVADKPFNFEIDGWDWWCNGTWGCNNAIIRGLITHDDLTGLKMAFRYDD